MKYIIRWMICVITVIATAGIFPGGVISYNGVASLIALGSVIWLVNLVIRPVIQLISLPITLLTVGIFSLIVNAFMVSIADTLLVNVKITSFWISLFIALVISIANTMIPDKQKNYR